MKLTSKTPLVLSPICKDIIWGGDRLIKEFGKGGENDTRIAETWELSIRKGDTNIIKGGALDGHSLCELADSDDFPVLIKFIDAKENLSVQVHPGDAYARENEGDLGKTEMWYVVDAMPGAQLVYGMKANVGSNELKSALEGVNISEKLNYVDVKKGDVFFIPAGCVHAIGGGILIAEIQQSSNVTYRVYDYGRGREVHVKKALDVIKSYTESEITAMRYSCADENAKKEDSLLADCEIFRVEKHFSHEMREILQDKEHFRHILVLSGEGFVGYSYVKAGDSLLLTKDCEKFAVNGDFEFLLTFIK